MKILPYLIFSSVLLLPGCRQANDHSGLFKEIQKEIEAGNISSARHLADSLKTITKDSVVFMKADSLSQIADRITIDYSIPEDIAFQRIESRIGTISMEEKSEWERKGWLEYKVIDGRKMYFNRASSNLILLRKFHKGKEDRLNEIAADSDMIFRRLHTEKVLKTSTGNSSPVEPVLMRLKYTITVHENTVPEGETIRCWMPWPKNNLSRQQKVSLISSSLPDYSIAPDSAIHSTIYMDQKSVKGKPAIFSVSFSYESYARHFDFNKITCQPYNRQSPDYKRFTSKQLPQINFSPEIKRLADSIAGNEENPKEIVRKIYLWFKENIPWTGAPEYSIMPDIPDYVCSNRTGDCGMQTFLFMSMLRYKGIPVKWQSGWMVPPGAENLHDWCEVYYEGTGWVPADISYDLQKSDDNSVKEFYLSGIDSYRMILNDGISGALYPEKHYLRSEPFDFQRGEVEWKGGNLYFDKWDYDIEIEYIK
jgi:hypothetical protein